MPQAMHDAVCKEKDAHNLALRDGITQARADAKHARDERGDLVKQAGRKDEEAAKKDEDLRQCIAKADKLQVELTELTKENGALKDKLREARKAQMDAYDLGLRVAADLEGRKLDELQRLADRHSVEVGGKRKAAYVFALAEHKVQQKKQQVEQAVEQSV